MRDSTKAWLYQTPAILVLVAAFVGSTVLKVIGNYPIKWASIIIMGIIIVLFFVGKYYDNRKSHPF